MSVTATLASEPERADPAAAAETVVEGDCERVPEGVGGPERAPDDVPEGDWDALAEALGDTVALGVALLLAVSENDALGVRVSVLLHVPLADALEDSLGDALAESVTLALGVPVPEGATLIEGVAAPLREPDRDAVPVSDGEREAEEEAVPERVDVALPLRAWLALRVAVWLTLAERLREGAWQALSDVDKLGVGSPLRVPLSLGFPLRVALPLGEPVRLGDRLPLPDGLELRVPLGLRVGAPLRVPVADCVREALGVGACERVPEKLRVAAPLAVAVLEGVRLPDGDRDADGLGLHASLDAQSPRPGKAAASGSQETPPSTLTKAPSGTAKPRAGGAPGTAPASCQLTSTSV